MNKFNSKYSKKKYSCFTNEQFLEYLTQEKKVKEKINNLPSNKCCGKDRIQILLKKTLKTRPFCCGVYGIVFFMYYFIHFN